MDYLRGSAAEKVLEAYLALQGWSEVQMARAARERLPGGRVITRTHDIFGCFDTLAVDGRGHPEVWAMQVTTPNNRSLRRRKVQGRRWPASWRISVIVVKAVPSGTHGKTGVLLVEDLENVDTTEERWSEQRQIVFSIARAKTALALVKAAKKKRRKGASVLDGAAEEAQKRKGTP